MENKQPLNEGLLDTALKGIVGIFFAKKLIKGAAQKRAMRDPEVKKQMKAVRDQMAKFDAALEKVKQDNDKLINKYS
jgi:hypothetical protein